MIAAKQARVGLGVHLVVIAVISALAYANGLPPLARMWPGIDKVMHFLLIGSVAFWLTLALEDRRATAWRVPVGVVLLIVLAGIEELLQGLSPRRTVDAGDFLANVCGALFFWRVAVFLRARPKPAVE